MYILLFLHISLGIVSLTTSILGVGKALGKREVNYTYWMKLTGLSSLLSVISGVALYIVEAEQSSLARFCMKLGLYLIVIAGAEAIMYFKLRESCKFYLSS